MKEGRQGVTVDKRLIGLAGIGFLLGRVWLFRINPFGVAFLAAVCAQRRGKKVTAFAVLLGMVTSMDGIGLLKYMLLFSMVLCLERLQKDRRRMKNAPLVLSLLCGTLNLLLGVVNSILAVNSWEIFWMSVLESVAVLALANVYQWAIRFFLYEDWSGMPGNEELLSVLVLIFTALYGIPREADSIFSVIGTISYLLVLFMGYRYGAAVGAVTGAAGGVLAAVSGNGMVLIGMYCLLGVSVGMFRQMGRVCSSLSFFLMACIMAYAARYEIAGIVELRAMVSAVIIFLALPRRMVHTVESDVKKEGENPFVKEDIRALASNKIEDFSNAFRRLSKSFGVGGTEQKEISTEEIEKVFEELSEKICSGCVNCNYCWDKHFEETSLNIHSLLWQAGRDGSVALEKISPDFGRRCIRLAAYVENAEEKMAVARTTLGWRNRLAENREVMARQMMEVAGALKSFTLDLEEGEELPMEIKKRMAEELKKEGVHLKRFSAKCRKNRMEVVFTGCCRGNQCLTKTDIADALTRGAGVYMCPGRETRNVLSAQEETMFFREAPRYKALTGLARMAKSGETVSGDNYSFLELQSGELVMVLADGMGSGETAYRDSGNLIEVLEHLMEAGFEKKSALRLLNTLFVANYEGTTFTTLDMVSVDLHTGRCEIMKSGAAATFIRRADRVDTILSEALPVGVDMEAESDVTVMEVEEGDMVIMVSDGVIDGFYGGRKPEEEKDTLEALIASLPCQNPTDMANQILMNALAKSAREATDDMSVLVAGIWNKI
ncbi:MAG: SpoIIE family protein phosphatase [Lachnospiraceae bacterium]|nr:SpoIIE family protein phosphatase [Lachnospiraceae bacterium]